MTGEVPPYSAKAFWSAEDECYVAVCPEFEGLSGLGRSREEAVAELSTALEMVVATLSEENEPLPIAAVQPAVSGQFRLRLPRSLHAQLVNRAELEGVSLNTLAVTLLAQGVAGARPEPDHAAAGEVESRSQSAGTRRRTRGHRSNRPAQR